MLVGGGGRAVSSLLQKLCEAVCEQKWLIGAQTSLSLREAVALLRGDDVRGCALWQLFLREKGCACLLPWTSCPQGEWPLAFPRPAVLGAFSGSDMSHLVGRSVV